MTADYCGIKPPTPAPFPRDAATVALDLRSAAGRMTELADRIAVDFKTGDMIEADATAAGIAWLLVELRQQRGNHP